MNDEVRSNYGFRSVADRIDEVAEGQAKIRAGLTLLRDKGALDVQIGGGHYKSCAIQPVQYIHANGIGYFEGNVIKYVTRWRDKGGLADLQKARHYIDLLIDLEAGHVERT